MRFRWTVIFSDIFIHAVTSHISLSGPRIIHWTSYWVHSGFISPYFKTFITKSRIIVGRPFPDCSHSFSDSAHFSLRPQQHLHFTSSSRCKSLLWYESYYYGRRVTTRQNISCGLRFRLTKTQGIINVSPVAETLDWRRRLPGNHSQCNIYLTHGIMGTGIPAEGLLRYRKWVPQQLGDVIVVANSPPIGLMRCKLTNHHLGIVLDVRAWS